MDVATGFWYDQSLSGWSSSMITLEVMTGALLISALAVFITLVGGRFWAIVAFIVHQCRTTEDPRDGLFHQHQLVYRNGDSHLSVAMYLVRISWAWKRRARLNLLRTAAFLLPPLVCFAGFAVASLFSTKVTTPSYYANRVPVAPKNCGYLNWNAPENRNAFGNLTDTGAHVYARWIGDKMSTAKNYARACYTQGIAESIACSQLPVQQLTYTADDAAPCPFTEGRCIQGANRAYRLTTPWFHSHEHFGINAAADQRVALRRVATCSVLNITDLTTVVNGPGSSIYQYRLGSFGTSSPGPDAPTYAVADSVQNSQMPYKIVNFNAIAYDPYWITGWHPIPSLNRTDADVVLFFLNQNSMFHPQPVSDPFFSAHRELDTSVPGQPPRKSYTADTLTTAMACTEQFQLLNPRNNHTTALSSMLAVHYQSTTIGLSPLQQETAYRLIIPAFYSLMGGSLRMIPGGALRASRAAYELVSLGLPDTQWQSEVQGWFEEALAAHQLDIMSFVSKSVDGLQPYGNVVMPDDKSGGRVLCEMQIMKNVGAYQTFSVLGLGIIAVVGVVICVVSLVLEGVVGFVRRKRGKGGERSVAWRMDSLLTQGRLAAEKGVAWESTEGLVPITARGETFVRVRE